MSIAIRNGKVVIHNKLIEKDILISGNKIKKIGYVKEASTEIDATGKVILPGIIDIHVHSRDPGNTDKEDWETLSAAAAHGGVTTICDMVNNKTPTVNISSLKQKRMIAGSRSIVNFGLYAGVNSNNLGFLKKVAKKVFGYKIYTGKTTGNLIVTDFGYLCNVFDALSKTDKVSVIHAENTQIDDYFSIVNSDRKDPLSHADSKPNISEAVTIAAIIEIARRYGTKVHVTHITTKQAVNLITHAKKQDDVDISCDTCPHYLYLTRENLKKQGAFAKMIPPLRTQEDQDALWKGITDGTIDIISTDHAPHKIEEKKKQFNDTPSGVPELDTFMPLMLDAVNRRKITLQNLIDITSKNPAERFNIKNKGQIEEGYDADLVIVDMNKMQRLHNQNIFSKCSWTPYHGKLVKGIVESTIVNGNIVFDHGLIFTDKKGKEIKN